MMIVRISTRLLYGPLINKYTYIFILLKYAEVYTLKKTNINVLINMYIGTCTT